MDQVLLGTHSVETVATGTALAPPFWDTKLCVCEKSRLWGTQAICEGAEAVREEKGPGLVGGVSHSRKAASCLREVKVGLELETRPVRP